MASRNIRKTYSIISLFSWIIFSGLVALIFAAPDQGTVLLILLVAAGLVGLVALSTLSAALSRKPHESVKDDIFSLIIFAIFRTFGI
jgi:uncharacterized protein (DUF58 family)